MPNPAQRGREIDANNAAMRRHAEVQEFSTMTRQRRRAAAFQESFAVVNAEYSGVAVNRQGVEVVLYGMPRRARRNVARRAIGRGVHS